jgi:hypothetical protein
VGGVQLVAVSYVGGKILFGGAVDGSGKHDGRP